MGNIRKEIQARWNSLDLLCKLELQNAILKTFTRISIGSPLRYSRKKEIRRVRQYFICVVQSVQGCLNEGLLELYFPPPPWQPPVCQGLLIVENSRLHPDILHHGGRLWTSVQPDSDLLHTTTVFSTAVDGSEKRGMSNRSTLLCLLLLPLNYILKSWNRTELFTLKWRIFPWILVL